MGTISKEAIAELERAAELILAPPNEVSPEARKQAETLYESAHQQLPLDDILNFLTNCNDAYLQHNSHIFLVYEFVRWTGETTLRDWSLIDERKPEYIYKLLLQFIANSNNLANYVVSAALQSVAMIIKRGIVDKRTGPEEQLYEMIQNLLTNESHRMAREFYLFF
ncbi:hypothetical protein WR25_02877 [Diploscapter pachys]|uniref:Importin N-terminal domain-containing protein n=1 Tax=Diploscapter pachys TaxID=2018661 RepID=A0A2A2LEN1_9BILA|nr:hypothetical protein WR25_02877 [Diploscapter pachys]